jgi:hypothetical protein
MPAHPLQPPTCASPFFPLSCLQCLDSFCPQRHYSGVADIYEDRLRLFAVTAGGRGLEVSTPGVAEWEAWRRPSRLLLMVVLARGGISGSVVPSPATADTYMHVQTPSLLRSLHAGSQRAHEAHARAGAAQRAALRWYACCDWPGLAWLDSRGGQRDTGVGAHTAK